MVAAGATSSHHRDLVMCDNSPPSEAVKVSDARDQFCEWAEEISQRPDIIRELLVDKVRVKRHHPHSKSLIWDTLQGEGKIEQIRLWKCAPDVEQLDTTGLKFNERPGEARIHALVQLGGDICGHPEFVHGTNFGS
jgi:hypothetical protein